MLINVYRDVYRTYQGDSGMHKTRLSLSILISVVISALAVDIEKSTFQIASLVITVLTGFTFTALFSNYSVTMAGLPNPTNENDLFDLGRLKTLGHNFAIRSKLFIVLALIDLAVIMLISTKLDIPSSAYTMPEAICKKIYIDIAEMKHYFQIFQMTILMILKSFAIFVFLECIYTFYRLAETILAVIEIRKTYVETKIVVEQPE